MTILFQWLVEHAWIFYAACFVGVIAYLLRALGAQRERKLALFTLERETATARVVRSWAMVVVFVVLGVAVFLSTAFLLPNLPTYGAGTPPASPTLAAGVQPSTPVTTLTPSPTIGLLSPTQAPTDTVAGVVVSSVPPPEPTEPPTVEPTDTPVPGVSGDVGVQFGDFAELSSFVLSAVEISPAQPLQLTLYWRGLEGISPSNYLVFTHLLAEDGHLVAQHDGPPAGGTRPTSEWPTGETIVDPHPMAFVDPTYSGPARIAVGLYDPAVGRVPTATGSDSAVLPVVLSVAP